MTPSKQDIYFAYVLTLICSVLLSSANTAFPGAFASSTVTIAVNSVDLTGNQITGMYMELQNSNGVDIATGFTPVSFSVTSGQQYIVYANDYQNIVFNHWEDGTTNHARTITPTQNMSITAYYSTGSTLAVSSPPTGLVATAASSSQINLSWSAPTNNGGSTITGYEIERSTDGGITWSTIVSNTGSTSTAYSDTGLAASTTYTYRVSAINSVGTSSLSNITSATTLSSSSSSNYSLSKIQSGLVASDSLTNETTTQQQLLSNHQYWTYSGDAIKEKAPYSIDKDLQGLHIGVQAKIAGKYAGFYAETPNTNAALFHAIITQPVNTIPSDDYNNGLYVQTTQSSVNYVTCVVDSTASGDFWSIVGAIGSPTGARHYVTFWQDNSANQPLTRDCTIITNGNNYLKVYLDGALVYTNSTLNLQMPGPFNAYLEPETSYAGQLLYGTYKDYYATTNENVQVTSLPTNATTVEILNSAGTVLASSPVSSGSATLGIGQYHFPLVGIIQVRDSNNALIVSSNQTIYGGDVYTVK